MAQAAGPAAHGLLEGKVVVITGAAQGMGQGHLERCVAEGASVVATDVQAEAGRAAVSALGEGAVFVEHDVTDAGAWDRVVATALDRFGRIDGLVNNAAILLGTCRFDEETVERVERTFRVNVLGSFLGVKKVTDPMRDGGGGSIVNISSTAGIRALAGFAAYGTSKWAVRGMTKIAAMDLGPLGIRVNSVHPGGIEETGMFSLGASTEEQTARLAHIPARRHGARSDVSSVVTYLLSDLSAYVTGVEHIVDGGSTL